MRALDYALRQGWSSLWRSRGAGAFAIAAIALALLVLGSLFLVTWNANRVLGEWTAAAEFSVYLDDDATSEQRGAIEAILDESGVTGAREYVSKAQALARFRSEFAELAGLTDGFEGNPFPASLEVRLLPESQTDGRADELVRRVATLPGVVDVRYDREWLSGANAGLTAVRGAGTALALLMALAASFTVATVVRLGLHARRDEVEIMQLVGAPLTFIRGPFVAEGLLQGGIGALVAIGLLWLGYVAGVASWGVGLAEVLGGLSLEFLPARFCLYLVAGGMAVGGAGGLAASRYAV